MLQKDNIFRLLFFYHYYFMTIEYSSETSDNFFEEKLQCKKVRIDCSL